MDTYQVPANHGAHHIPGFVGPFPGSAAAPGNQFTFGNSAWFPYPQAYAGTSDAFDSYHSPHGPPNTVPSHNPYEILSTDAHTSHQPEFWGALVDDQYGYYHRNGAEDNNSAQNP